MISIEEDYGEEESLSPEERDIVASNISAYDEISLSEKLIEPSDVVSKHMASRNLQLGNIEKGIEFRILSDNLDTALKFLQIPERYGGWLSKSIGDDMLKRLDLTLIMSNSKEGKLREMIGQRKTIIDKKISGGRVRKRVIAGMGGN